MYVPVLRVFCSPGLPKATVSTEAKAWAAAFLLTHAHVGAQDRLYLTLPLYHMSGLHAGLHGAIESGEGRGQREGRGIERGGAGPWVG